MYRVIQKGCDFNIDLELFTYDLNSDLGLFKYEELIEIKSLNDLLK